MVVHFLLYSLLYNIIISGYIQELLRKAIELCEREETEQSSSILPEPLSSGYDHPHKAEAIRRHKSRFKNI